jgi:hypothetical protein
LTLLTLETVGTTASWTSRLTLLSRNSRSSYESVWDNVMGFIYCGSPIFLNYLQGQPALEDRPFQQILPICITLATVHSRNALFKALPISPGSPFCPP